MFKQPITRLFFAGLAGLAGLSAAGPRAHAGPGDFTFPASSCSPLVGYQVEYDNQGVHSVGSSGAWVLCADGVVKRRYKGFTASVTDRSTTESVICAFWGKNKDTPTYGPQTAFSGANFTGDFYLFAGLFPNVESTLMAVQCWLPAPSAQGASYLHSVFIDVH